MKNISKYALYGFSILGVLASILALFSDDYDTILYVTYVACVIAVVLALLSGVYTSMQKPGSLKQTLIGLGAFAIIAIVSYLFSSDEVLPMYGKISAGEARFVDVQLISMYILCIGSVVAIVYSSIVKFIK